MHQLLRYLVVPTMVVEMVYIYRQRSNGELENVRRFGFMTGSNSKLFYVFLFI